MEYRLASGNKEIRFNCPFCEQNGRTPDTKQHLYVSLRTGNWICFRCGERGRSLNRLPENLVLTVLSVAGQMGIQVEGDGDEHKDEHPTTFVPEGFKVAEELSTSGNPFPLSWLMGRLFVSVVRAGIEPPSRVQLPFGSVYYKEGEDRLFLVSRTPSGEVDYAVERRIRSEPKYVNPPSVKKPLFKVGTFPYEKKTGIIVVEGPMDALFTAVWRRDWVVAALLGKTLTASQMDELSGLVERYGVGYVVLWLDRDVETQHICRMASLLHSILPCKVGRVDWQTVSVQKAGDPADMAGRLDVERSVVWWEEDLDCWLNTV